MSATVAERPELAVTRRDTLFADIYLSNPDHPNYDVFPNGRVFLMLKPEETRTRPQLLVVLNWTEELKRRVRAK